MKILAVECSATPASVAICEDGKILASAFSNVKLTHSQTLMPMVENVLKASLINLSDIEGIAVAAGPGSFTGIRIGISAVKGLAQANNLKCVGVSTLEAMAQSFTGIDGYICAVMDARCNQVYNAIFKCENGKVLRICDDRTVMLDDLLDELKGLNCKITVCGDGTDLLLKFAEGAGFLMSAYGQLKYQNAIGVALLSEKYFKCGQTVSPDELLPVYLRLPQAERELKKSKTE